MLPIAYKRRPAASERLKRGCVFARRRAMEPGRGALFFVLGPWSTQIRCTECRFGSKFMQKQGMAYRVLVFQARWKANRIARCFRLCFGRMGLICKTKSLPMGGFVWLSGLLSGGQARFSSAWRRFSMMPATSSMPTLKRKKTLWNSSG